MEKKTFCGFQLQYHRPLSYIGNMIGSARFQTPKRHLPNGHFVINLQHWETAGESRKRPLGMCQKIINLQPWLYSSLKNC
jgi:hypothetical protein